VFLLLVAHPMFDLLDDLRQEPLVELTETVNEERLAGEDIVAIGFKKPSIVFYTQQPVTYLSRPSLGRQYLRETVQAGQMNSTLFIVDRKRLRKLGLRSPQFEVLDKEKRYRLVRIYRDRLDKFTHKDNYID
jgi:hypothetical protein